MSSTATAGIHTFAASATDRTRCECGKSRNTSAHGYNAKARSAAQAGAQAATAKAEKVTAKAKAQADTAAAAEDAVTAVYEKFAASRTAPLAVVTLDGTETAVQAEPTPAKKGPSPEAVKTAVEKLKKELTAPAMIAAVAEGMTTEAPAASVTHRISWFVYLEDGVRTRYSSAMTGELPAWDLTCSCGWDSRTGGATKGSVRKLMAQHKAAVSA
jgi:hypothetical protein